MTKEETSRRGTWQGAHNSGGYRESIKLWSYRAGGKDSGSMLDTA
jgi:hypothetical protein